MRKVYVADDMAHDERVMLVAEHDPQAALMWPWILMFFDDWGRAILSPKSIKAKLFPMHPATLEDIAGAVGLYSDVGLIIVYGDESREFMAVHPDRWWRYQTHIKKEKRNDDSGSKYPAPPLDAPETPGQGVVAHLRAIPRDSAQKSASLPPSPPPSPPPTGTPPTPPRGGEVETQNRSATTRRTKAEDPPGFAEFWALYPRKIHRAAAARAYRRLVSRGGVAAQDIENAARNYAAYVEAEGVDDQHVCHGSTFLGPQRKFESFVHEVPEEKRRSGRLSEGQRNVSAVLRRVRGEDPDEPGRGRQIGGGGQHVLPAGGTS